MMILFEIGTDRVEAKLMAAAPTPDIFSGHRKELGPHLRLLTAVI
jgi:hypothetical protein